MAAFESYVLEGQPKFLADDFLNSKISSIVFGGCFYLNVPEERVDLGNGSGLLTGLNVSSQNHLEEA